MHQSIAEQPYLLIVRDVLASLREMVGIYEGTDSLLGPSVAAKLARARAVLAQADGQ